MGSEIVLGYPYSGALYAYIDAQVNGEPLERARRHGYYRTLYGLRFEKFVEHALMLVLIYDKVHLTPADNAWPKSNLTDSHDYHPELGLSAPWSEYGSLFNDEQGLVRHYLEDPVISKMMPRDWSAKMILSSIIYESTLAKTLRCELLCAPSRKAVIKRMLEIDRPALHPVTAAPQKIEIINNYMQASGLVLAPEGLDDLMRLKSSKAIREYTSSFASFLGDQQQLPKEEIEREMLRRAREALDVEEISRKTSGWFQWLGALCRITGFQALGSAISLGGNAAVTWELNQSKWVSLAAEVSRDRSKNVMVRRIEERLGEISRHDAERG